MAISDEKRREAARKLRNAEERTMMELTDGELLDLLAEAVGLDRYESEHFEGGLFYCLADLIDRPTCCNVYDEIYDEYEGAVVKTASSAASAERSSRIARATASRGRSITARSAGERW